MAGIFKGTITQTLYLTERGWQYVIGWRQYGIGRRDLVLDVGSGGHPFIRADILCDRFLFDNAERQRQEPAIIDRPFVVADATRLPFRDRAFDFSYSSHLLEHLDEPSQHLQELQRVSRRGVIITPSEAWERIYPIDAHRWVVNHVDSTLALREKPSRAFDPVVADIFHNRLEPYGLHGLQYFLSYFRHVFEVHYRWDAHIRFAVERLPAGTGPVRAAAGLDSPSEQAPPNGTAVTGFKATASRMVRRCCSAHYRLDLWSLLVCPACRGELSRTAHDVRCDACARRYQLYQGRIPILVVA